jgi:hypothetical protein
MKPRPKIGGGYDNDNDKYPTITEEKSFININKSMNAPYRQNESSGLSELPNLRIPQVCETLLFFLLLIVLFFDFLDVRYE